jgi:hypothetical protein
VSDNLTEGNISLQVEVPTASSSSDEGPRMSQRKMKPQQPKLLSWELVRNQAEAQVKERLLQKRS